MKKFLSLILAAVMLASLSVVWVSAHDQLSHVEWGTPVIDGIRDEVWDSAQMFEVKHIDPLEWLATGNELPANEIATAKTWTLWDGDFIYVYVEVYDKIVDAENREPIYDQDCVGLMIDFAYNRTPGETYRDLGDDSYAGYVNVSPFAAETTANFPEEPTVFGLDAYKSKVKTHSRLTDFGYVVEAALPLIYKNYSPGDKIGFEIFLNNGIGNSAREGVATWGPGGSESWTFSEAMGTLVLNEKKIVVEQPTEPEPPPPAPTVEEKPTAPEAPAPAPETGDQSVSVIFAALAICLASAAAFRVRKRYN